MNLLILTLNSIRTALLPTPLKLYLETPIWAHQWSQLKKLFVFTATPWGMFVSTALTMSALTADSMPPDILSTGAFVTTAHSVSISAISPAIAWIDDVPFVTT